MINILKNNFIMIEIDEDLTNIAEAFLKRCKLDLDEYTSDKGTVERKPIPGATMFTPAYVQFAKYGRGPGKQPPVESILDYVIKDNIKFDGLTQRQAAWAIAIKIGREGTKGYTPNAPNFIGEVIELHSPKFLEEIGIYTAELMVSEIEKITPTLFPNRLRL